MAFDVQNVTGGDGTGTSFATFTLTIAAIGRGNTGYGYINWYVDGTHATAVSVKFGASDTAQVVDTVTGNAEAFASYFLSNVTDAPTTVVFTFSGGNGLANYIVATFTELAGQFTLDGHAMQYQAFLADATNGVTSGLITPGKSGDFLSAGTMLAGTSTVVAGTGFTINNNGFSTGSTQQIWDEYLTPYNSTAAVAGTFTPTSSGGIASWITGIMAFAPVLAPVFEEDRSPRFTRHVPFRRHHNDPDIIRPFIHPPWRPFVFDDQGGPLDRFTRVFSYRRHHNDPDLAQPSNQWVRWNYDEPPGPRRELIRGRINDPDLVGGFIHPPWMPWHEASQIPMSRPAIWRRRHNDPDLVAQLAPRWAPYVFDDQDNSRRPRTLSYNAPQNDSDLGGPSPGWITWNNDEPPGPRRALPNLPQIGPDADITAAPIVQPILSEGPVQFPHRVTTRARTAEPDPSFSYPPTTIAYDEPAGPRRLISRGKTNDPDIAVPTKPFVFLDELTPFARRLIGRAKQQHDPDIVVATAPFVFLDELVQLGRKLIGKARPPQDPDIIVTTRQWVFLDELTQFAKRLVWRAKPGDPDLAQRSPLWTTFAYDEPPGPRRLLGRAKTVDPDIAVSTTRFVFLDELVQFGRKLIGRARPPQDPDLVGILGRLWAPFVFDDQDSPRHPRPMPMKARQGDPDLAEPIITFAQQPFLPYDELVQLARRLIGRAKPPQDPDLVGRLAPPFVFDAQDAPRQQRPAPLRARQGDPDLAQVTAPTVVLEEAAQLARRLVGRAKTTDPDLIGLPAGRIFVFPDEPALARQLLLRARALDAELILPTRPLYFSAYAEVDAQRSRELLLRAQRADPETVAPPKIIPPAAGVFIETDPLFRLRFWPWSNLEVRSRQSDPFTPFAPPIPVIPFYYGSYELTAPQYILDFAGILPPGVTITRIISAIPLYGTFDQIQVIAAARAISPVSGLIQAISGEVQATVVPAVVRFVSLASNGYQLIIDGIYMGKAKFVYFPTPLVMGQFEL